ncbi:hypothetical protein [Negadavirga shengliensis]|uniref:Uncharacterized protein n=1 Tax=Negadavirga shengliensis TaxID=1389218 RepID=A0ABV9T697_9BACT
MYLTVIRLIALFFLLGLFSCSNQVEYIELEVLVSDTVKIEEKVLARIYSNNSDWKIVKAYFECEDKLKADKVDALNETIEGCSKELFVRNDTVIIQFTPTKLGLNDFGKIKTLMKKGSDKFKVLESDFSYIVIQ